MSEGGGNPPPGRPPGHTGNLNERHIVDSIALNWSDKTTPDRADRARKAWALYGGEYADGIGDPTGNPVEDLIADLLHLANTDEHPGGAPGVMSRAVRNYEAELASWPAGPAGAGGEGGEPEAAGRYLAQARGANAVWLTVGQGDDRRTVAELLWKAMQEAEFRFSELAAHTEDLMKGYVIASNDGFEFRVIERDER